MITTDKLQSILKKDLEDTVEAEIVGAAKKEANFAWSTLQIFMRPW